MARAASFSEVDAMRDVDAALEKLDPDAQRRVLDWAASKYKLTAHARIGQGGSEEPRIQPRLNQPSGRQGAPRDIKTFLAQKRPGSSYERVACLVYYLEKFDGRTEVNKKDIEKANSDARLSKMTKPGIVVKNATHTYGYLTSIGNRQLALSTRGEAVVEALPDHVQVEEAHKNFPFGKRAGKKRKRGAAKR
jgi:hypothetical protein